MVGGRVRERRGGEGKSMRMVGLNGGIGCDVCSLLGRLTLAFNRLGVRRERLKRLALICASHERLQSPARPHVE